jgi:hypothetical protein
VNSKTLGDLLMDCSILPFQISLGIWLIDVAERSQKISVKLEVSTKQFFPCLHPDVGY